MKSKTVKISTTKTLTFKSQPTKFKSTKSQASVAKSSKGLLSKLNHARWSKITKVAGSGDKKTKRFAKTGKCKPAIAKAAPRCTVGEPACRLNPEKEADDNLTMKQPESIRKQVFLLLHRPSGFEYFYHLFVILLIISSCCLLNILKPKHPWDDIYIYTHYQTIHMAMCGVDSFLTVFLFTEMLVRFWSAEHNPLYLSLLGKGRFLVEHPYLAMDFLAMLTFFGYVLFNFVTHTDYLPAEQLLAAEWWVNLDSAFRIAHVVQVLQVYRLIYKLVRPIFSTIYQQANQLLLALFVAVIVMIICSVMVFLCNLSTTASEGEASSAYLPAATNFAATIWHCFVAFSTVGYDTKLPYSRESLTVLACCSLLGVWSFMLPSIILGNGLSITVSEQRRMTFRYVSIAEMIRTAIAHHQTTNRRNQQQQGPKKPKKERQMRLVTDHLQSFTKLDILKRPNDRLFKINYDGFDSEVHSLADDDEQLWNKLLTIDQRAGPLIKTTARRHSEGEPAHSFSAKPSLFANESLPSRMSSASMNGKLSTPKSGTSRVLDCFENMDLSKYSNDNSVLWYNLGLIEDGMDEMTDVVCNHLVHRVDKIHQLSSRLVLSIANLKREVSLRLNN